MRGPSGNYRETTIWVTLITAGKTRSVTSCRGENNWFVMVESIFGNRTLFSISLCFVPVTISSTAWTRSSGLAKLHTSCIRFASFCFFSNLEVTVAYILTNVVRNQALIVVSKSVISMLYKLSIDIYERYWGAEAPVVLASLTATGSEGFSYLTCLHNNI